MGRCKHSGFLLGSLIYFLIIYRMLKSLDEIARGQHQRKFRKYSQTAGTQSTIPVNLYKRITTYGMRSLMRIVRIVRIGIPFATVQKLNQGEQSPVT